MNNLFGVTDLGIVEERENYFLVVVAGSLSVNKNLSLSNHNRPLRTIKEYSFVLRVP